MKRVIIDASAMFYSGVYANQTSIENDYNLFAHIFLQSCLAIKRKQKADELALAVDSSPYWRKNYLEAHENDIVPTAKKGYKGQRKQDMNINWNRLFDIYYDVLDTLDKYSDFLVLASPKCEADDIIARYVEKYGSNITIISRDSDLNQLLSKKDNIKRNDFFKDIHESETKKKDLVLKIIQGDKSDNIPAVKPRTGVKTAMKILDNIKEEYKDETFKKRFHINRTLIDLSKIPEKYKTAIDDMIIQKAKTKSYNQIGIIKFCKKYDLNKLMNRTNEFKIKKGRGLFANTPTRKIYK